MLTFARQNRTEVKLKKRILATNSSHQKEDQSASINSAPITTKLRLLTKQSLAESGINLNISPESSGHLKDNNSNKKISPRTLPLIPPNNTLSAVSPLLTVEASASTLSNKTSILASEYNPNLNTNYHQRQSTSYTNAQSSMPHQPELLLERLRAFEAAATSDTTGGTGGGESLLLATNPTQQHQRDVRGQSEESLSRFIILGLEASDTNVTLIWTLTLVRSGSHSARLESDSQTPAASSHDSQSTTVASLDRFPHHDSQTKIDTQRLVRTKRQLNGEFLVTPKVELLVDRSPQVKKIGPNGIETTTTPLPSPSLPRAVSPKLKQQARRLVPNAHQSSQHQLQPLNATPPTRNPSVPSISKIGLGTNQVLLELPTATLSSPSNTPIPSAHWPQSESMAASAQQAMHLPPSEWLVRVRRFASNEVDILKVVINNISTIFDQTNSNKNSQEPLERRISFTKLQPSTAYEFCIESAAPNQQIEDRYQIMDANHYLKCHDSEELQLSESGPEAGERRSRRTEQRPANTMKSLCKEFFTAKSGRGNKLMSFPELSSQGANKSYNLTGGSHRQPKSLPSLNSHLETLVINDFASTNHNQHQPFYQTGVRMSTAGSSAVIEVNGRGELNNQYGNSMINDFNLTGRDSGSHPTLVPSSPMHNYLVTSALPIVAGIFILIMLVTLANIMLNIACCWWWCPLGGGSSHSNGKKRRSLRSGSISSLAGLESSHRYNKSNSYSTHLTPSANYSNNSSNNNNQKTKGNKNKGKDKLAARYQRNISPYFDMIDTGPLGQMASSSNKGQQLLDDGDQRREVTSVMIGAPKGSNNSSSGSLLDDFVYLPPEVYTIGKSGDGGLTNLGAQFEDEEHGDPFNNDNISDIRGQAIYQSATSRQHANTWQYPKSFDGAKINHQVPMPFRSTSYENTAIRKHKSSNKHRKLSPSSWPKPWRSQSESMGFETEPRIDRVNPLFNNNHLRINYANDCNHINDPLGAYRHDNDTSIRRPADPGGGIDLLHPNNINNDPISIRVTHSPSSTDPHAIVIRANQSHHHHHQRQQQIRASSFSPSHHHRNFHHHHYGDQMHEDGNNNNEYNHRIMMLSSSLAANNIAAGDDGATMIMADNNSVNYNDRIEWLNGARLDLQKQRFQQQQQQLEKIVTKNGSIVPRPFIDPNGPPKCTSPSCNFISSQHELLIDKTAKRGKDGVDDDEDDILISGTFDNLVNGSSETKLSQQQRSTRITFADQHQQSCGCNTSGNLGNDHNDDNYHHDPSCQTHSLDSVTSSNNNVDNRQPPVSYDKVITNKQNETTIGADQSNQLREATIIASSNTGTHQLHGSSEKDDNQQLQAFNSQTQLLLIRNRDNTNEEGECQRVEPVKIVNQLSNKHQQHSVRSGGDQQRSPSGQQNQRQSLKSSSPTLTIKPSTKAMEGHRHLSPVQTSNNQVRVPSSDSDNRSINNSNDNNDAIAANVTNNRYIVTLVTHKDGFSTRKSDQSDHNMPDTINPKQLTESQINFKKTREELASKLLLKQLQ